MKHFTGSFIFSFVVLAAVYFFTGSWVALLAAATLAVVETVFSFDNAVVNAKILEDMNEFWRKIFLTVGILVAVVGMRFYLPIQIVSSLGGMGLIDAFHLATGNPAKFSEILHESKAIVAGAGGSFLFLLGLKYFIDAEKEEHWLPWLENIAAKLGGFAEIQVFIVAVASFIFSHYLGEAGPDFFFASLGGIGLYIAVDIFKSCVESLEEKFTHLAIGGLGTFVYLEVLDASFSFDGVIAAFAISDSIWVIAAGLGIGAYFVRSLTMYLVDKGTMNEYRYLEHGAMWAILMLAGFMWTGLLTHIPEAAIAATSVAVLGAAFWHSHIMNRKEMGNDNHA